MGKSNYKLTDEQKRKLNEIRKELIETIMDKCADEIGGEVDPYDDDGNFDNNKFTAMVWYIGDELSSY